VEEFLSSPFRVEDTFRRGLLAGRRSGILNSSGREAPGVHETQIKAPHGKAGAFVLAKGIWLERSGH